MASQVKADSIKRRTICSELFFEHFREQRQFFCFPFFVFSNYSKVIMIYRKADFFSVMLFAER